jgi:dihydropyrimidinase
MSPSARRILIRGGTVVTAETASVEDLLVEGETIAAAERLAGVRADEHIDASGLLVLPGAVDTHVHFNDAFMGAVSVHDYSSGTRAAAYGGVTSVIDFSNQEKGEPLLRTIDRKRDEAAGRALIDWGVHPVVTQPSPETIAGIPEIVAAGAPTVKCYLTYRKEGLMVGFDGLKAILAALRRAGGMLLVHAEDNDALEDNIPRFIRAGLVEPIYHARSRPPEVETAAIRRSINAARETGGRLFIVHMASAGGVGLVATARDEGLDVHAETCTHYLVFTEDMLGREDGIKWICSPPLRAAETRDRLWEAVRDGVISQVSSDDAAYSWEAKLKGAGPPLRAGAPEGKPRAGGGRRHCSLRPQGQMGHGPGDAPHGRGLVGLRRHPGDGENRQGVVPRRAPRRRRSLPRRKGPRPLPSPHASPSPDLRFAS